MYIRFRGDVCSESDAINVSLLFLRKVTSNNWIFFALRKIEYGILSCHDVMRKVGATMFHATSRKRNRRISSLIEVNGAEGEGGGAFSILRYEIIKIQNSFDVYCQPSAL